MQYRVLGKTGLKISIVAFGGIPIQRITKEDAAKVIHKAEELGINFIDTARGYTVSEEYVGNALTGRRNKWIVATKSMSRDGESMARDIETSLRNLQTDYIDLYQLHNIKSKDEFQTAFGEGGAYRTLLRAKEQGKIRHIGVTSHSLEMLEYMIENADIDTVMYPYSIVETQAKKVFEKAAERNIGVLAMKPLAGGAIEDGALAMKYVIANKHITAALPGMATIEEVIQNAGAVSGEAELTDEEKSKAADIAKSLGGEFCRRCGYCSPCAQDIDIPLMFLLEGYKKRYDLGDWAESRYEAAKKHAEDCIGCGACEPRCPYNLPIRKMLSEVREHFGR